MAYSKKIIRGTVLTPEKTIHNGAVVVENQYITDIGQWDPIRKTHGDDFVIGNENSIVSPGFVDTHTHAVQTLFRGAADDRALLDWLNEVILPGEATLTAEEVYASCQIGYAEMLLSGITTTNDMLTANHSEKGLQAAVDSGIRGHVGKMLMDRNVPSNLMSETSEVLEGAYQLADQYQHGGLIEFSFTPRFVLTCSEELMSKSAAAAKERGLMLHTHASENRGELEQVKSMTGREYIQSLHDFNSLGDHVILAHCVHTTENERQLLKLTNTNISHNPSSNGKLGSGIAPIPEYLDMGLNVGLATDGSPATGGHDFFLEMKLASYFQKATRYDSKVMPAKTIFNLATSGGAKALNFRDVGTIKEGYKADIQVLDTSQPNAFPRYDPYSFIVYSANKSNVSDVLVNGDLLVHDKQLIQDMTRSMRIAKEYAKTKPFLIRS